MKTRVRDVLLNPSNNTRPPPPFLYKRATYGEKRIQTATQKPSTRHKTEYYMSFKTIPGQPAMRYATGPPAANKRPEMSGQEARHNTRREPEGGGGGDTSKYRAPNRPLTASLLTNNRAIRCNEPARPSKSTTLSYSQVENADGDGFQPRFAAAP